MTPAPLPLTKGQRTTFLVVAVLCALTRLLAMARSHWGWDEALFLLGMRDFDVTQHHPHPPGFPIFLALGKLLRLAVDSDFRALQSINLIAGALLFPALFAFAREIGFRFTTSSIAAALCCFFPNLWFFGGTALSDVPSIVLAVFAAAMLLRGRRDANAYLIGTVLLALAMGIRPQNFLIGLFPGMLATWHRARASIRDVIFAALLGTVISLGAFALAAIATGNADAYLHSVREHGQYISRVDSFRNPGRPPLWRLVDRFFFTHYQSLVLSIVTSVFVLISAVGAIRQRDRAILYNVLTFGPVAIMTWMMLDRFSVNRFSIGYAPMFAVLAADGIARAAKRYASERGEAVAGGALILAFLVWTLPALTTVRNEKTPTAQALEAVRQHVDPQRHELYVAFSMHPHVDLLAPGLPYIRVKEERSLPLAPSAKEPLLLAEFDHITPTGLIFQRDPRRLFDITRRNYYDVMLQRMNDPPRFVSGWHAAERDAHYEWRWMAGRSTTELAPVNGTAKLALTLDLPLEVVASRPVVTVTLNGLELDRITALHWQIVREYDVLGAPGGAKNVLELATTATMRQPGEARVLGLRLRDLVWGPRVKAR